MYKWIFFSQRVNLAIQIQNLKFRDLNAQKMLDITFP